MLQTTVLSLLIATISGSVEPCTTCETCLADRQQASVWISATVSASTPSATATSSTYAGAGSIWAYSLPSSLIGECTGEYSASDSYSEPGHDLLSSTYVDAANGTAGYGHGEVLVDARVRRLETHVEVEDQVDMVWYSACGVVVTIPNEGFAKATDHVITNLARTSPSVPYTNLVEFTFDIQPHAYGGDLDRCTCEEMEQAQFAPRKYFFRMRAVARNGVTVLSSTTRAGNVTVSSGGVSGRQGIWNSSELSYSSSSSGDCELDGASSASHVLSRTGSPSDLRFTVSVPGEPTRLDMYREFFEIAIVRGDVTRDTQYDINDLTIIDSLVGTDIDADPDGVYDPDGDLDLDGDIDQDDVDAFYDAFCPADVNDDHTVDFNDYLDYMNLYGLSDPAADMNGDTIVDFSDQLIFLNRYTDGC